MIASPCGHGRNSPIPWVYLTGLNRWYLASAIFLPQSSGTDGAAYPVARQSEGNLKQKERTDERPQGQCFLSSHGAWPDWRACTGGLCSPGDDHGQRGSGRQRVERIERIERIQRIELVQLIKQLEFDDGAKQDHCTDRAVRHHQAEHLLGTG